MILASNVVTLISLATTVYCVLIYKCASSMNIISAFYYIYIYTPGACLGHGLYMLEDLTQLVSWVGDYVHAWYIQYIHFEIHPSLL